MTKEGQPPHENTHTKYPPPGKYLLESGLLPELTAQLDKPWGRRPGESFWYQRFLLYLRLGRGRTVYRTYAIYREQIGRIKTPPPRVPLTWERAADRFQWEARAGAWGKHLEVLARQRMTLAREILQLAAPEAALALIQVMREGTPIQQRQAAKVILDRVDDQEEDQVIPIQYILELNEPEGEVDSGNQEEVCSTP